jgi:hypothetical protein
MESPARQLPAAGWMLFSGVGATPGFGYHLRIRPRSRPRIGARFGCRCTAVRGGSLAVASFRGSQTPRGKNNTKRIPIHLCLLLSRPTLH